MGPRTEEASIVTAGCGFGRWLARLVGEVTRGSGTQDSTGTRVRRPAGLAVTLGGVEFRRWSGGGFGAAVHSIANLTESGGTEDRWCRTSVESRRPRVSDV